MRAVPFAPGGAPQGSQAGSKDEGDRQRCWLKSFKHRLHRVACGEQALLFVHRAAALTSNGEIAHSKNLNDHLRGDNPLVARSESTNKSAFPKSV
jgi:hypothetical protein